MEHAGGDHQGTGAGNRLPDHGDQTGGHADDRHRAGLHGRQRQPDERDDLRLCAAPRRHARRRAALVPGNRLALRAGRFLPPPRPATGAPLRDGAESRWCERRRRERSVLRAIRTARHGSGRRRPQDRPARGERRQRAFLLRQQGRRVLRVVRAKTDAEPERHAFAKFLRMGASLHPAIIDEIAATGRLPKQLSFALPPAQNKPAAVWVLQSAVAVRDTLVSAAKWRPSCCRCPRATRRQPRSRRCSPRHAQAPSPAQRRGTRRSKISTNRSKRRWTSSNISRRWFRRWN